MIDHYISQKFKHRFRFIFWFIPVLFLLFQLNCLLKIMNETFTLAITYGIFVWRCWFLSLLSLSKKMIPDAVSF